MRRFLVGLVVGLLLGALAGTAGAQVARRLFGTTSAGAPIALQATTEGVIKVACQ